MASERSRSLQEAAPVLFVLMAVLPLLIFTWLLYRLDALGRDEAQIAMGASLVLALAGFVIFRSLMRHLSDFVKAMSRVAQARLRRWAARSFPPARVVNIIEYGSVEGARRETP